ncbi:VanZ family protein [Fretibacter rubidus]|uniref:VanZ family protein n=1 Tax=Fretibacter rubidus TaxID=570162 RepID=UPI00352A1070
MISASSYPRPHNRVFNALCGVGFIALIALITQQSLVPAAGVGFSYWDKLMHFAAYFGVAVALGMTVPKMQLLWVIVLTAFWGGAVEIAQGTLGTGRSMSLADQVANSAGAISGAIALLMISKLWSLLKARD